MQLVDNAIEIPELRDYVGVFADRADAGRILAQMLAAHRDTNALVVAIPAGGVPVGMAMAGVLNLSFDVAPVSKITLPWNSESGYGAVAFDGTVRLNEHLLSSIGLSDEEVALGQKQTLQKVQRRMRIFRGDVPFPKLDERPIIVVDDGLASGFTMRVALEALRKLGAKNLIVAVPTAHVAAISDISRDASQVYCANVRSGRRFAVASAYRAWRDVSDEEVVQALDAANERSQEAAGHKDPHA